MLKKMLRYWPAAVIVLIAIGAVVACLCSSANFRYCINHEAQQSSTTKDEKSAPAVRAAVKSGPEILFACVGDFSNDNANPLTAVATFFLMLVTGGLVIIGYQQIRTTRGQLRAYVFVEFANLFDGGTWPNVPVPATSNVPNTFLQIKNYGQTPAFNVRHWSDVTICPIGAENSFAAPQDIFGQNPTAIGPGGYTTMMRRFGRALTPFEISALGTVGQVIVVFGKITYRDVFRRNHTTTYRLAWAGPYPMPPQPPTTLVFTAEGNSAD